MTWWRSRTTKAFQHFQQAVQQHFGFLETLGYEGPRFSSEKSATLKGWVYTADYQRADRKVTVEAVDSRRRNVVIAVISRQPRRGLDDEMELDLFARKHSPEIAAALSKADEGADKSVESVIAVAFPLYASLLAGAARKVIAGEHWESGFYTDWTI